MKPTVGRDRLKLTALALAGGGALWLGFFPANLGFLGFVALVPFLYLIARVKPRGTYLAGFLGGLLFGALAVQWVRLAAPAMYFAWLGLALLLAMHFLLFVGLTRWLVHSARLPLLLAAPVVWTALEYGRAHIDIGFAWYLLGHTQHDYPIVLQAADVFGAYGLSFLLVMFNVVVLQAGYWLASQRWPSVFAPSALLLPAPRGLLAAAGLTASVMIACLAYGGWRLSQTEFAQGPKVALVQGNVPQEVRNDPALGEEQDAHFDQLGAQAGAAGADLIVFPETSYTFHWLHIPAEHRDKLSLFGEEMLRLSERFAREKPRQWNAALLLGINSLVYRSEDFRPFNSAILLDRNGSVLGQYDKCCRVPFGEYLPFVQTLPFMKWFSPYDFDYGIDPGRELTLFELPSGSQYRFAVLICYEDSVPHLARRFMRLARPTEPIDFFLNISNDGWFRGSEEHEQHLVAARFRAVENRRALARAVNMGISAVIDGNGRMAALPGETWGDSKAVAGIVAAYVPIDHRSSLYVFWGDILPQSCAVLLGLGMCWAVVNAWRSRRAGKLQVEGKS